MQQESEPKHTSRSTKDWLEKNKMKVWERPTHSPDHDPVGMVWKDLKWAVHVWKPSNIPEFRQTCMGEWAKIPPT